MLDPHASSTDPYDGLLAQLDHDEQTWNPNKGDVIAGTVSEIVYVRTKDGRTYPMVRLSDRDGGTIWTIGCGRAKLRGALDRRKVQPGDRLAIRYDGERPATSGRPFHDYRVAHTAIGPRDPSLAFDGSREADDDLGLIPGATSTHKADGITRDGGFQP